MKVQREHERSIVHAKVAQFKTRGCFDIGSKVRVYQVGIAGLRFFSNGLPRPTLAECRNDYPNVAFRTTSLGPVSREKRGHSASSDHRLL